MTAPAPPATHRALVVEDFDELRDLLLAGLRAAGYQADGAGSVAEAVRMRPESYDVLVTDMRLGDADGAALLGIVGANDPTINSRCVLMTGGGFEMWVPPDVPVLVKPFPIDALVAAVRAVLAKPPAESGTL